MKEPSKAENVIKPVLEVKTEASVMELSETGERQKFVTEDEEKEGSTKKLSDAGGMSNANKNVGDKCESNSHAEPSKASTKPATADEDTPSLSARTDEVTEKGAGTSPMPASSHVLKTSEPDNDNEDLQRGLKIENGHRKVLFDSSWTAGVEHEEFDENSSSDDSSDSSDDLDDNDDHGRPLTR